MQGVPGPGQYHIKSQFGEILSSIDTDHTDLSTDKAPFGSTLQVCAKSKLNQLAADYQLCAQNFVCSAITFLGLMDVHISSCAY